MAEQVTSSPSLARRLVVVSMSWTLLVLVATYLGLSSFNRDAVEKAFDRRLQVFSKLLIADIVALVDDPTVVIGANLGEPLFGLPQSGWYWQVTRLDGEKPELRQSRSLWDGAPLAFATKGMQEGYLDGPNGQYLRGVERMANLGEDGNYVLLVAGNAQDIEAASRQFNWVLASALALLGLGMLIATFLQVRIGLLPLVRMSRSLSEVRNGTSSHLLGAFPQEIQPLALEINALIDRNTEIVERARTHVGNLAHALKTPISVLINEAGTEKTPLAAKVEEQSRIMQQQVDHHLQRARLAARIQNISTNTDVQFVLERLIRTMERIYQGQGLTLSLTMHEQVQFRGEQQDLEEMAGNVIDNACKWAKSQINVDVRLLKQDQPSARHFFCLDVDDDGQGLTAQQRDDIGRRGVRLDESKPGTGLGLSIVKDLSELYGGVVSFHASDRGGLKVRLVLPCV